MNQIMQKDVVTKLLCGLMFVTLTIAVIPAFANAQDDGSGDYVSAPDYSSGDNLGYFDLGSGGGDYVSAPDYSGDYVSAPDYAGDYVSAPDVTDTYGTTDIYGNTTTDESGIGYSYENYSTPSYSNYSTPTYAQSFAVSAPGYSAPRTTTYQAPVQQQQQQIGQPINIVNTNTNTNINTNTAPVAQATPQYVVQYTYPQQQYQPTYNNYTNVSCSITASPNSIQNGQYTYLSWTSYGATYATLTNYGNVAPDGSLSVRPGGSMNYVLTVYGQNGQTSTCNTYVSVNNAYVYPSVTLSQIPYTGFDFGTMGDAMYWASLMVFALAAGYLLVYYNGGMVAFAGSMIPVRRSVSAPVVIETQTEVKVAATPVPEHKAAPTFADLPVASSNARPTIDSMTLSSPKSGEAPRIVITRG